MISTSMAIWGTYS